MKIRIAIDRHGYGVLHLWLRPMALLALLLATFMPAFADDIRVFSGGAPQHALLAITAEFEKGTGHRVVPTFALVTIIQQKLAAGEKADLILLPIPLIAATEKTIALRPEGRSVLARVGIAVIVRSGAPKPDISTPDAVRKMLLDARTIALSYPGTPVGAHLNRMMTQLGIADEVKPKIVVKAAIDGGGELVAKGEADVGMYLVSEVQSIKGIAVVGLLPPPVQSYVVYGSAIPAYNTKPDAALAFLKFVSDPARSERWTAAGFELMGGRN
jgi:molybdate transport system substrate-binding protein